MRPAHSADLTPEQRFRELACILATGLARLLSRPRHAADSGPGSAPAESPEFLSSALELPGHKSVTVSTRVDVSESRRGPTIPNRRSR
jgi:hypothetical protein